MHVMSTSGQILRVVGLLIELVGVGAVLAQSRTDQVARIPIPGGSLALGWAAVATGFLMWLVGRIIIARSDRISRNQKRARDDAQFIPPPLEPDTMATNQKQAQPPDGNLE